MGTSVSPWKQVAVDLLAAAEEQGLHYSAYAAGAYTRSQFRST
jgi:hypothetical protein